MFAQGIGLNAPDASAAPEQSIPQQDVSLLTPIFLIQRPHYTSGQTIMVRLGFRNASRHVIDIRSGVAPWITSTMTVIGPDGKPIPRGLLEIGGDDGSGRMYSIPPGGVQFFGGNEWYPLDHWSFHLTEPGTYRITVKGLAAGIASVNVQNERSTTVTVTVDP